MNIIKKALFLIFTALSVNAFSQNIQLPVSLKPDFSGLEMITIGKVNNYRINITYDIAEFKKSRTQALIFSFAMPVPSSSQFQKVSVISANFLIKNIIRDNNGNTVLLTDVTDITKKTKLSVVLDIECIPSKFIAPENFIYDLKINDAFIKNISRKSAVKTNLLLNEKIPGKPDFNDIMEFIKLYKDSVNQNKDRMEKIYDPKISAVYPITKRKYFIKAVELLTMLSHKNIFGRINTGINIPPQSNALFMDFIIEIYVPGRGFLMLDKELEPFINKGYFISCCYQNAVNPSFDQFYYLGIIKEGIISFIKSGAGFTGAVLINDKPDVRYGNSVIETKNKINAETSVDNFLLMTASVKNKDDFIIIGLNEKDYGRIYDIKPSSDPDKNLILCRGVKDSKPLIPGDEFDIKTQIYALLAFKSSVSNKTGTIRWLKPGGKIYRETKLDIPGNWGYYYTYITPPSNGYEKGVWAIEITFNNKLEIRKHFTVK